MVSSAGFVTTLCFLVSFICVAQMMDIPAKKSEDTAAPDHELKAVLDSYQAQIIEKRDGQTEGLSFLGTNIQASYFLGQCVTCPPGKAGPEGMQGIQGQPGRDGRDQLVLGAVEGEFAAPLGHYHKYRLRPDNYTVPGVLYTRWGKAECPESAELVYEGSMAGSHYNHKGSGVNFLCMPHKTQFGTNTGTTGGAYIYGTEYNTNVPKNQGLMNSEAPCAVCLAKEKRALIMIPARTSCPGSQDWSVEYRGVLMASYYTYSKTEFVCVDENAEGIPRTAYNNQESILYTVVSACSAKGGGLPCPPYAAHNIYCVVCTM